MKILDCAIKCSYSKILISNPWSSKNITEEEAKLFNSHQKQSFYLQTSLAHLFTLFKFKLKAIS